MTIHDTILRRMEKLQISERELAIRMGADRSTVWNFLHPRPGRPGAQMTLRTLNRIARALECEAVVTLRPLKGGR